MSNADQNPPEHTNKSPTDADRLVSTWSEKKGTFVGTLEIEDFYWYSFQPRRRYGDKLPAHPQTEQLLSKNIDQYGETLLSFRQFIPQLREVAIEIDPNNPQKPAWRNYFFPGLDAVSLFGLISILKPKRFFEIGSGHSTRFAALAKRLNSPDTHICSIDPAPRAEIDALCDRVIRKPLQDCDLSLFDELEPGDILFFDGSHRVLQNSDNTVLFLEVYPRIKKGILLHLHDIHWPYDYPEWSLNRFYSEQYILGALLTLAPERCQVLLPNAYLSWGTQQNAMLDELWNTPHLTAGNVERHGASFWFKLV